MSERIDHHCAKQGTISCKTEHNAKLSLTRLPLIRRGTHRTRPSWALGSGSCLWNLASTVSCWRLKCSGATGGRCGSGIRLLNSWFIDELISRERGFCLFILVQQSVKSFVHLTLKHFQLSESVLGSAQVSTPLARPRRGLSAAGPYNYLNASN